MTDSPQDPEAERTLASTGGAPPPPPRSSFPLGAVIGIVVLALVGLAMLGFALVNLLNPGTPAPTQPIAQVPTIAQTVAVVIPTATAPPAATATEAAPPTAAPTETSAASPPTSPPAGPSFSILVPANVRAGPGVNYAVIGGLGIGSTAEVVGRDASASWYVINYQGGQGWVSNQVAQYTGDTNALPVITAPPTPRPTATPVPPTAPPATARPAATATGVSGVTGNIRVDYFFLTDNITQVTAGTPFQFKFKITNLTGQPLSFGGLGAIALPGGPAQPSWSTVTGGQPIPIGGELEWEDNMTITRAGTYKIHLGICVQGTQSSCENPAGWQTLSGGIDLIVR